MTPTDSSSTASRRAVVEPSNIPEEKIYELGNFQRGRPRFATPPTSASILSHFDVSTETRSAADLRAIPPLALPGTGSTSAMRVPMDIISPIKDALEQLHRIQGHRHPVPDAWSPRPIGSRCEATPRRDTRCGATPYFFVDGAPYLRRVRGNGARPTFTLRSTRHRLTTTPAKTTTPSGCGDGVGPDVAPAGARRRLHQHARPASP